MWFWWFMFICDMLIPMLMVIVGNRMRKQAPEKINEIVGYRTARSMKNMDTWKFAHDHCGRLWWKIGWSMLIPSFVVHIPLYRSSENMIGLAAAVLCTIQCVILILSVFLTEKALKRTFTEDGMRK